MRRRLFNALTLLSLLLFVAVCVIYVRTFWVAYSLTVFTCDRERLTTRSLIIRADNGLLWVRSQELVYFDRACYDEILPVDPYREPGWYWEAASLVLPDGTWPARDTLRFDFDHGAAVAPEYRRAGFRLLVPQWVALLPCGSVLVLWLWKHRQSRQRTLRGRFCVRCGYDLRATPGRCPECGTAVAGGSR